MKPLRPLIALAALVGIGWPAVMAGDALPAPPSKSIALTFDDAPRAAGAFYTPDERTALLIGALRATDVRQVAFFLNPGRIAGTKGAAERIAAYTAAGHVIADHTFSHHDVQSQSAESFLADVDKAEAWLRGRPGYRPWLRFPGLNQGGRDRVKRQKVLAGLAARGMMVAPVTIDGSDWNMERLTVDAVKAGKPIDTDALRDLYVETMVRSADFGDALMRRAIGRSPAHVILLHETDLAARYIGELVVALRRDGWRIITPDAAFADPIYHLQLDVPAVNGTLPEAIAWQKGITGPTWYERNDIKLADRLFDARVLHQPAPVEMATPASARPAARFATRRAAWQGRHRSWRRAPAISSLRSVATRRSGTTT